MAYMNQERKKLLAAEVAKVVPSGWKYSLAVRNHSTIVMTISEAPLRLMRNEKSESVNPYRVSEYYGEDHPFVAIIDALNVGNHDRSDIQTDYFDVGWYVDVQLGRWDKPFISTLPPGPADCEHSYEDLHKWGKACLDNLAGIPA
jgi:hypothetical protein